jgi:hypothetical protein
MVNLSPFATKRLTKRSGGIAWPSEHMKGGCPFLASGTPAASAGASDGAENAENQIERLRRKHSPMMVQEYLVSIASQGEAKQKMHPYFDKPTSEIER